jgi:hypothetical protein
LVALPIINNTHTRSLALSCLLSDQRGSCLRTVAFAYPASTPLNSTSNAPFFATPPSSTVTPKRATPKSSVASVQRVFQRLDDGDTVEADELSAILPSLVVEGKIDSVRFALEHNADPNRPTDAQHPFSALYAAVQLGNEEIVKVSDCCLACKPLEQRWLTDVVIANHLCACNSCCSNTTPRWSLAITSNQAKRR